VELQINEQIEAKTMLVFVYGVNFKNSTILNFKWLAMATGL